MFFKFLHKYVHDGCVSTGQHWQKSTGWDPRAEWVDEPSFFNILCCFLTTIVLHSPCINVACCIHTGTFVFPVCCVWMHPWRIPKYICYKLTFKHKTCSVFSENWKGAGTVSLPVYIQQGTCAMGKRLNYISIVLTFQCIKASSHLDFPLYYYKCHNRKRRL